MELWGQFLGRCIISSGDAGPVRTMPPRARATLAFFMLNPGEGFSRERLLGTLYESHSVANPRKALINDLYAIRSGLENHGVDASRLLAEDGAGIGMPASMVIGTDVGKFDSVAESGMISDESEGLVRLEEAMELYSGDLLPDLDADWCLFERERLRDLFIVAGEKLVAVYLAQRAFAKALPLCRRLLQADDLLEQIHRALMWCHYAAGNRAAALRHYRVCETILRESLDVEPMAETRALYQRMLVEEGDGVSDSRRRGPNSPPVVSRSSGVRTGGSLDGLRELRAHLRSAGDTLDRIIGDSDLH